MSIEPSPEKLEQEFEIGSAQEEHAKLIGHAKLWFRMKAQSILPEGFPVFDDQPGMEFGQSDGGRYRKILRGDGKIDIVDKDTKKTVDFEDDSIYFSRENMIQAEKAIQEYLENHPELQAP